MYPKIYLSIDNCFATKRWTKPGRWAEIIKESGLRYVETSADTECDMLYSDKDYLRRWREETAETCERNGLTVDCTYTGHGTYSTLGLTHTDKDCRERMLKEWMFPHIDNAGYFGAVAGFYCHAFDDTVMQDPEEYGRYKEILYSQMERIAEYAEKKGVTPSLEQMYSPRQYPWRITDGEDIVKGLSGKMPFCITIDTGHQTGQRLFRRPDRESIENAIDEKREIYVGTDEALRTLRSAINGEINAKDAAEKIDRMAERTEYMFAEEKDGSPWEWLKALGSRSPVIHLQQTDGKSSSHRDFSEESNKSGIITGEKVLKSLYTCYKNLKDGARPAEKIYLTLELFYSNTTYNSDIIRSIRSSVEYWRHFIPYDGIPLDFAVKQIGE
ncbi:MAG: hypothetical protein IKS28_05160 [Clostridia bacterium]|nr:hypothetical protein [Clostridia bacterium]